MCREIYDLISLWLKIKYVITFRLVKSGIGGGASRTTNGSGVHGFGPIWRIISGGAGAN